MFDPMLLNNREALQAAADKLAVRLDTMEAEYDKGWKADVLSDGSLSFHRSCAASKRNMLSAVRCLTVPKRGC